MNYSINFTFEGIIINFVYLASIVLFIFGIKFLSSPKTARRGNMLSALAMLVAVAAALFENKILNPQWIAIGIAAGALIGLVFAYKVEMTQMPEMVAIFNGFGGGASALVALAELFNILKTSITPELQAYEGVTISLSILVGSLTFTGSIIAFGKLQGFVPSQPIVYVGQKIINGLLFAGLFASIYMLIATDGQEMYLYGLIGIAAILGVTMVIPIGGADMPVVISLLNSYSGVAASLTGFVLNNYVLIVAGALVGASGLILTMIMCEAMNRSLANVLFGAFGAVDTSAAGGGEKRTAKGYSVEDAIMAFDMAETVIVVPGYGLAVAQAQHVVHELEEILEGAGKQVKYAIHPVAGRMPGHMNVLLAESNVDYEKLVELDNINPEFESTDVVLVVGANDVVNPAARDDESSPIAGMPILEVDKARTCMVLKRSLSFGFAGIDNELFYMDSTMMIFGDAKETLVEMVNQAKNEFG